jgi:hypothetical protein
MIHISNVRLELQLRDAVSRLAGQESEYVMLQKSCFDRDVDTMIAERAAECVLHTCCGGQSTFYYPQCI